LPPPTVQVMPLGVLQVTVTPGEPPWKAIEIVVPAENVCAMVSVQIVTVTVTSEQFWLTSPFCCPADALGVFRRKLARVSITPKRTGNTRSRR